MFVNLDEFDRCPTFTLEHILVNFLGENFVEYQSVFGILLGAVGIWAHEFDQVLLCCIFVLMIDAFGAKIVITIWHLFRLNQDPRADLAPELLQLIYFFQTR